MFRGLLALSLLVAACAPAPVVSTTETTSASLGGTADGFTAAFPRAPLTASRTLLTKSGAAVVHVYVADGGAAHYAVFAGDEPSAQRGTTCDAMLADLRDALLSPGEFTIREDREIADGGRRGREIRGTTRGAPFRARMLVGGGRFVVALAVAPAETADLAAFAGSLRMTDLAADGERERGACD